MNKKLILGGLLFFAVAIQSSRAQAPMEEKIKLFPLGRVTLLESPFKRAQETNKTYLLALEADRLLAPFLREAGLAPTTKSYTNWENTGLDGHIGGHYLTALSLMYASTHDEQIKSRLDYVIQELKRCQDHLGTGYIGGVPGSRQLWEDIEGGRIAAGNFDLNKKWVPLYNIHKTYAGLRDAYTVAGNVQAKEMLIKMTDWAIRLVQDLSHDQIQDMLRSEHGGLNEIFADVAFITGEEKYLALAKQFTHESFLNPLIEEQDRLTGMHANTQIPKVIGVKRIADLNGEKSWNDAARFFWETVVNHRTVAIGGNSAHEHFHPTDDFSNMINSVEGPETCNTYNMLKLSAQFFQTEEDVRYVDFYEKGLYNHILSTQHPEHGGFVYFTPMRPGHYRVYSQPQTSFWCCVGSGLENHSKYGEFIYAHRGDDLWVNLFIPSILDWKEKNVKVTQHTSFPEAASTQFRVDPDRSAHFALKIRYPKWVKAGALQIAVNGKKQRVDSNPGEYITLERKWKKGDIVDVTFEMHSQVEQMPDESDYFAFTYGPIVLASKTGIDHLEGLQADDSRGGHIAKGPQVSFREIPMIVGDESVLDQLPERVSAKELRFALHNVYRNKQMEDRELVPFYQVHDSRYIIYWPQAATQEAADQQLLQGENRFAAILDSMTVDRVNAGQQQPESDHNIQYENAETGVSDGVQWREAEGWFAYTMRNIGTEAKYLYVQYFDQERPSHFDILVNDHPITTIALENVRNELTYQFFALPASLRAQNGLTVQFRGRDGQKTARIVEVRLLMDKPTDGVSTTF